MFTDVHIPTYPASKTNSLGDRMSEFVCALGLI